MALDYLKDELRALADHHALRRPEAARVPTARDIDFTSNDYLGAARGHVSRATSDGSVPPRRRPRTAHRLRPHGPQPLHGTGASRLVHGTHPLHELLEQGLASWVQQPAALLFASGYAANLGALSALAQPEDLIISDELNHASIIDGCRLSRAQLRVVPHLDLTAVESALKQPARRRWVVCESYYSMDGDMADLPALRRLCDQHGAYLYVDEAHALGVFGPNGSGLCARSGVKPEVLIGTLGKALGSHGAFVAGEDALRLWLWNRARSFVFSTATAPSAALQTLQLLHWAQHAEEDRKSVV